MSNMCLGAVIMGAFVLWSAAACAQQDARDYTCFQTGSPYLAEIDIGSDVAVVYGIGADFADRAAAWRAKGYLASMMTGIAWGGYDAYFGSGDAFRRDEIQTDSAGRLMMHGDSTTCGYNVPTAGYVEFIKRYVDPAIDAGVRAIYLEEPEYWAVAGWSAAFKAEWQRFYGEPWQPPDSSVDAQYRASKLKYELYFNALKEVFSHVKRRAAERGIAIECHVPTHSLINYAQWRIVSPESHLMDLPDMDGYIAQVWTGTARTPNMYRGVVKERTFETAFLEFGQALGMVRPTGRKVWFLADPVEDNPNHSWADYKLNYECTIIASLLWPEVYRFEVMPWPDRIFRGTYPVIDMGTASGAREGIPADYATEILAVINALNDMNQTDVRYETGSRGIGVLVSDTLMFQRAEPQPSDPRLGGFYALALPLVKNGIPVEVVQLENVLQPGCLERYKVLLLTYEGQKPLRRDYHVALDQWVRRGGGLIYIGDGADPYHVVREWWNDQGATQAKPTDDLFQRLGVTDEAFRKPIRVDKGYVRVLAENPVSLQENGAAAPAEKGLDCFGERTTPIDGAQKVLCLVRETLDCLGEKLKVQNYLLIQRGPYVIASVLDESVSDQPLRLQGAFVDVFDPNLRILSECTLKPGERALLYDLNWARANGMQTKVAAAGARVRGETVADGRLTFVTRGPKATTARVRVLLQKPPAAISLAPETPFEQAWDAASSTLLLSFGNRAEDVTVALDGV